MKALGVIVLFSATVSLTACASIPAQSGAEQTTLAAQVDELQKLKAAEYHDYLTAMTFEETNRKLGNYYAAKGSQVHGLISEMEDGKQVNDIEVSRALDDGDSVKYDDTPPEPRAD